MQMVAESAGPAENIDRSVHVFKRHLPYHESDHVLSIAYNLLAGGSCLEQIELRHNDEVFLAALGVPGRLLDTEHQPAIAVLDKPAVTPVAA